MLRISYQYNTEQLECSHGVSVVRDRLLEVRIQGAYGGNVSTCA